MENTWEQKTFSYQTCFLFSKTKNSFWKYQSNKPLISSSSYHHFLKPTIDPLIHRDPMMWPSLVNSKIGHHLGFLSSSNFGWDFITLFFLQPSNLLTLIYSFSIWDFKTLLSRSISLYGIPSRVILVNSTLIKNVFKKNHLVFKYKLKKWKTTSQVVFRNLSKWLPTF